MKPDLTKLPIERMKVAKYMKVSKEVLLGHEDMDYYHDLLTVGLYAFVYAAARDTGVIKVNVKRPTFLDWLLRRTRTIEAPYIIQHLIKADGLPPGIDTLPIIQFNIPPEQ